MPLHTITLVLQVEAESHDAAVDFAENASHHLLETFNDDDSIKEPVSYYTSSKDLVQDWASIYDRAKAYDTELNRLEIAPNGDDYNALLEIVRGGDPDLPTADNR